MSDSLPPPSNDDRGDSPPPPSNDDRGDSPPPPSNDDGVPPIFSSEPRKEKVSPHHHIYYIDDPMVILLVEGHLFKVHKYFLERESQVFHDMFSSPPGPEETEGSTDKKAISLPGVTCAEFKHLLDFLYKGLHDTYKPNRHSWIDVLSLSTRYIMDEVRERAIREIESTFTAKPLYPMKRISLAFKFEVTHWLPKAYCELCARAQPIQAAEAAILGLDVTLKLFQAREAVRQGNRHGSTFNATDCSSHVQEAFGIIFSPSDV